MTTIRTLALALGVSIIAATAAQAADFPISDVEKSCYNFAGGSYNRELKNNCIDLEQSGYNEAKFYWPKLTDKEQADVVWTANRALERDPHLFYSHLGAHAYIKFEEAKAAGRIKIPPHTFKY